ncbi:hypothetical protein J2795_001205 [Chryseobacterium bernardetii]|uniref:DUF3828 domain-containing protein n=2 Tax=Chryseobacterium TaxID=59732 RepID=A0A543EJX4_9FLAO|nr:MULTISPECIES: hypothetical protein [Chryseobacterium]MDR6370252.1 hypothetical protein [Chryseobacterium vietnamense]MDR6440505.1 hypothetical protein [Chryseobacterium bernardetii]TQM21866.1 hypothetical protein FB551_1566 [Chryseobacterium aquifrigidense]
MKKLFLCLVIFLFFVSCKKSEPQSAASSEAAITEKVNELYTQYGKSNEAIYNQPIPDTLFSQNLKKVLDEAISASKADIEKVKNSDHPDEKPLIFEGAMFSSLYEGFTDYKIKSVKIQDKTAEALVAFEYNMASPKVTWMDTVNLTNTDEGWRVDNITFDTIGNSNDLRAKLTEFVKSTQQ